MTTTTYAADRTALLIVDPYNDFMSEGGKLYEATKETAEAVGFYDNMRELIPAIRAAGIQVVIVPHHRWRESDYKGGSIISSVGAYQSSTKNLRTGAEYLGNPTYSNVGALAKVLTRGGETSSRTTAQRSEPKPYGDRETATSVLGVLRPLPGTRPPQRDKGNKSCDGCHKDPRKDRQDAVLVCVKV